MKLRLTHWTRSLLAVMALTSQASDAVEVRVEPASSNKVEIESGLIITAGSGMNTLPGPAHHLPTGICTNEPALSSPLSNSAVSPCSPTSFVGDAPSPYHSRAPPVAA